MPQSDRWLPASEKGTLAHAIMEDYCNTVFLNKAPEEIPSQVEEELLEKELHGYSEYKKKVKYRLIPFIW